MSKAVKGTKEFNVVFDQRMEALQKLKYDLASQEELSFEVNKFCDWINGDPRLRRNLDGRRYREILDFRPYNPDHPAWKFVDKMLSCREAQNSTARKFELKRQHEQQPTTNTDADSQPIVSTDIKCLPVVNADTVGQPIVNTDAESEN